MTEKKNPMDDICDDFVSSSWRANAEYIRIRAMHSRKVREDYIRHAKTLIRLLEDIIPEDEDD